MIQEMCGIGAFDARRMTLNPPDIRKWIQWWWFLPNDQTKRFQESLTHKFEYVWKSEISNEEQFATDVSNCSVWPAAADAVLIGWKISKIFLQNNACQRCVKFPCCTVRGVRWFHRFSCSISFDVFWRKGKQTCSALIRSFVVDMQCSLVSASYFNFLSKKMIK